MGHVGALYRQLCNQGVCIPEFLAGKGFLGGRTFAQMDDPHAALDNSYHYPSRRVDPNVASANVMFAFRSPWSQASSGTTSSKNFLKSLNSSTQEACGTPG